MCPKTELKDIFLLLIFMLFSFCILRVVQMFDFVIMPVFVVLRQSILRGYIFYTFIK